MKIFDDTTYDDPISGWDSVYGFDMSCIRTVALTKPLVVVVEAKQSNPNALKSEFIETFIILDSLDSISEKKQGSGE